MHSAPSLLTDLPDIIAEGRLVAGEAIQRAAQDRDGESSQVLTGEHNVLIHGDNLDGLARLVASNTRAKLVYLDPPFDSKADYRSRIQTRDDAGLAIALEMHTYTDRWAGGTADYLRMLVPRLVLAKEVLREDGAICVHLDWHSSHYVRVVLDEVFGRDNFVNSLVWSYRTGGAARTSAVPRKHDDLLVYRRSESFRITPLYERQYLQKSFMASKVDALGRHYVDTILRDVLEGAVNLVADDAANAAGQVRQISVRPVLNLSAERTGYATQKPEGLLELLVRWMTQPGDMVIDPFGGSGTTATAAERLGRRWVSMDASARSLIVTRARLDAIEAKYVVEELDAREALHAPTQRDHHVGSESPVAHQIAEYTWDDSGFTLVAVQPLDSLAQELEPARGQAPDSAERALGGSGIGALAGWHLWSCGASSANGSGAARIAGAWRDARGNLATTASIARPPKNDLMLELVDLVGNRVTQCILPRRILS